MSRLTARIDPHDKAARAFTKQYLSDDTTLVCPTQARLFFFGRILADFCKPNACLSTQLIQQEHAIPYTRKGPSCRQEVLK